METKFRLAASLRLTTATFLLASLGYANRVASAELEGAGLQLPIIPPPAEMPRIIRSGPRTYRAFSPKQMLQMNEHTRLWTLGDQISGTSWRLFENGRIKLYKTGHVLMEMDGKYTISGWAFCYSVRGSYNLPKDLFNSRCLHLYSSSRNSYVIGRSAAGQYQIESLGIDQKGE